MLALAIAISASASTFTIINAFLFRPLPVDRPNELVSVATLVDHHIELPHGVSYRDLQDYARLTDVFSGLMGYQPRGVWLDAGTGSESVIAEVLTDNGFRLLGVRPAVGRLFTDADTRTPVVVIAHDYWQTRFGGDPSVLGRSIRLNGQPFTVIGVTNQRFAGLESLIRVAAFLPLSTINEQDEALGRDWRTRHRS